MFEKEADKAKNLYDKLYKQKYPASQIQFKYIEWFRGYIAQECADKTNPVVLLDVGCGWQQIQNIFKGCFSNLMYYGLDVAPEVKPFFCCSAHEIPLGNSAVDFVWSCDFIEHVPSNMVDSVFQEIHRIIRKKAMVSVATIRSGRVVSGENLHLTVEDRNWWHKKLDKFFIIDDIYEPLPNLIGFLLRKRDAACSD